MISLPSSMHRLHLTFLSPIGDPDFAYGRVVAYYRYNKYYLLLDMRFFSPPSSFWGGSIVPAGELRLSVRRISTLERSRGQIWIGARYVFETLSLRLRSPAQLPLHSILGTTAARALSRLRWPRNLAVFPELWVWGGGGESFLAS